MERLENPRHKHHSFHGMITSAPQMLTFFETIKRVAATDSAVLIRGESGTGKELVAQAIHNLGRRSQQAYNTVNCAMLTPELINSELFGHTKGSFTGAVNDHTGYFEASHKGSLFLDEIAELPLVAQSRFLRAIQEKTITKVGTTKSKTIDVRLISATHKSLRNLVGQGLFREDLMYRIRVVPIFLPRLTQRGVDIEILTWKFIDNFNQGGNRTIKYLSKEAKDAILAYPWPGNIRELRNNIEYAFAIGIGDTLTVDELTPELRGETPPGGEHHVTEEELTYEKEERNQIIKALNEVAGNKGLAAEALGISRSTLWRKMKTLGI